MIPPLKTNMDRCVFQTYHRSVSSHQSNYKLEDGTIIENATVHEERTEFAECHKDKCMAYHNGRCIKLFGMPLENE